MSYTYIIKRTERIIPNLLCHLLLLFFNHFIFHHLHFIFINNKCHGIKNLISVAYQFRTRLKKLNIPLNQYLILCDACRIILTIHTEFIIIDTKISHIHPFNEVLLMEWNVSYCSQSDVVEKCLFGLIRDLYYSSTFIHKRTRIEHVLHNKNLVLLSSITIGQLLRLSCFSFIVSLIFMRDIFLMACVFVTITERRIRGN